MMKFWLGFVGVLLVAFLWTMLELITAPLRYPLTVEFGTLNEQPVGWTISTLPEAIIALPIGIVVGIVLLHVSNGFGYVSERIAMALLGAPEQSTEAETEQSLN